MTGGGGAKGGLSPPLEADPGSDLPERVLTADMVRTINEAAAVVPFSRVLGIEVTDISADCVRVRFAMQDDLIGNPGSRVLHGGVIAAVLDTVGGFAGLLGILQQAEAVPADSRPGRSPWLSTIDLRTDYLRPGIGERFEARGFALRVGSSVAVTRMELFDDDGGLLAGGRLLSVLDLAQIGRIDAGLGGVERTDQAGGGAGLTDPGFR